MISAVVPVISVQLAPPSVLYFMEASTLDNVPLLSPAAVKTACGVASVASFDRTFSEISCKALA